MLCKISHVSHNLKGGKVRFNNAVLRLPYLDENWFSQVTLMISVEKII